MSWPPPSSDPRLAIGELEPLAADAIETRLDEILDPVLSSRRTAGAVARDLAGLERRAQDFVLQWAGVIARTNPEMAFQFAAAAPSALRELDFEAAEAWIIQAMDAYDRDGLYRGTAVFRNAGEFASLRRASTVAVGFDEVSALLRHFACGLAGRALHIDGAARPYTDTETLYLPPRVACYGSRRANFLAYKAMTGLMWAQVRYGTLIVDLQAACNGYPDPARALSVVTELETVRLEARIARALPGLAREIASLHEPGNVPDPRCDILAAPEATVNDTLELLGRVYRDLTLTVRRYAPILRPDAALATRRARLTREKSELQMSLARLFRHHQDGADSRDKLPERLQVEVSDPDSVTDTPYRLRLDDRLITPTPEVVRLLDSIRQDLGEIPEDYLVPAGDGAYDAGARSAPAPQDVWQGVHHEHDAHLYNEWDHARGHYRKNWCVLRERDVHPGDARFVAATVAKYSRQVAQLKRTFEMLRGEDRLLKGQPDGTDIDLDAVIRAYSDMRCGNELAERLHVRRLKAERDLAVMFMVDMSGSTRGWINDAEREALVMLCEALEVLGDRYAIYGFSGMTRKRCEVYRVKRFDEPYGETVKSRIAGISPQDYTRMGVAVRHLSRRLAAVDARTKLLVTLSDGKPDDYSDHYRGAYGIEDTRRALAEAQRSGIRPFCITIDRDARDYLPHMYGSARWTLVDDVTRLPLRVADIYRRLTA